MNQIVYISCQKSQQIYVWKLEDSGELKFLQIIDTPGQVQPMVIHPNKTHLYVGVRPLFSLISYRIQADGTLSYSGTTSLPGSPSYISTDLIGRYLFSASYTGNCVSVSKIKYNGVVTEPIQKIDDLITPHSANIDLTNQRLIVPCLKEDRIRLFNFNLDGRLKPLRETVNTTTGSGPRHMAFHHNGKYAYCVKELDGTVDTLSISKNLKKYHITQTLDIMPVTFLGTRWASDIHITPNGRFLYTSERTASILTIFRVSTDGSSLSVIDHHSIESQPRSFNIDNSGSFIISACQKSSNIVVHKINKRRGTLSLIGNYPVGENPVWVSLLGYK